MKKLKFMALEKDCRVFDMYINTASKMAHKTSETSRFPYDIWLSAMDLIHPPALKNYGFFFFFLCVLNLEGDEVIKRIENDLGFGISLRLCNP